MDPFLESINRRHRRHSKGRLIFLIVVVVQLALLCVYIYWPGRKESSGDTEQSPLPLEENSLTMEVPEPEAPPQALQLLRQARALYETNQLQEAYNILNHLMEMELPPSLREETIQLLGETNIRRLNSPLPMEGKEYYVIQPGDSLDKISRKFKTTIPLLKKMNGLTSNTIRVNERLLVFNGVFSIVIHKSTNELDLLLNGKLFKRYRVGTGKYNKTPEAEFKIVDKIKNPAWWKDGRVIDFGDPENILGTRWMKIESADHPEIKGYGIHGTTDPDSIGKQSSAGCIRMLNNDVEELFDIVPRNTVVMIQK